jgi:hypothetical protein
VVRNWLGHGLADFLPFARKLLSVLHVRYECRLFDAQLCTDSTSGASKQKREPLGGAGNGNVHMWHFKVPVMTADGGLPVIPLGVLKAKERKKILKRKHCGH